MKNLVIKGIFIVLLARDFWVRARPQDSPSSTPVSTGDLDPPDLESEDTQKRYVIANPPRQERPGNFVRWGTQRRPNLPWENPPPRNQRQRLNHNLRLHSFQNTYPFESEVRGEGYHSRIRFDPFGGVVPLNGEQYPAGQTFGNWPSRPSNTASSAEASPQHNINPTSFRSSEVHGGTRVAWTSSSSNPGPSHHLSHEPQHSSNLPVHEPSSGSPPFHETSFGSPPFNEQSSGSSPFHEPSSGSSPFHEPSSGSPPFREHSSGRPSFHEQSTGSPPFHEQSSDSLPFHEQSSGSPPFHEPSSGGPPFHEPPSGSPPFQVSPSTYRPAIARPFVHPGNLAALLEGGDIGDGSLARPEDTSHDQKHSTDTANSRPDYDYPIVANVFNDEVNHEVTSEDSSIFHDENRYPQTDVAESPTGLSLTADREGQEGITHLPEVSHIAEISTEGSILSSTTKSSKSEEHTTKEVLEGDAPTASLDYNSEYYEFYDEFLEMYYDADDYKQSGEPKNQQKIIPNSEKSLESQTESSPVEASPENTSLSAATGETATRIENLFPSLFAPEEPLSAILTTTAPSSTVGLPATSTTTFAASETTEFIDTTTTGSTTSSTEIPSSPQPLPTTIATTTTTAPPPTSTTTTTESTSTTTATTTTTESTSTTTTTTTTTSKPSSTTSPPSLTEVSPHPSPASSIAEETGSVIGPATENTALPDEQHLSPESSDDGIQSTGSNTREQPVNVQVNKESGERKSTTPSSSSSSSSSPSRDLESSGRTSLISLSEILQGIGMSLPQFLVALKGHGMTLKDFTESLQKKSLTQQQFKRAKGDLGSLLEILQDSPVPSTIRSADVTEEVTQEPEMKVSLVPYWLTSRPTWRPSSTTESTTTSTTTTTTPSSTTTTTPSSTTTTTTATSSTTELSTTTKQPSTSAPPPKIFGFMPTFSDKMSKDMKNKSKNATDVPEDVGKAPIPIKLDIAGIMKDKGLSASDILHDLGSLFTFGNDSGSERNPGDEDSKDTSVDEQEKNVVAEESTETQEDSTSTLKPYIVPENPVSLRPYRPSGGSERYRPRTYRPDGGLANRGILTNRFHTTVRTTLLPPYQPPPVKPSEDISSLLDVLHNSAANTEGGSISFGLPLDADSVPGIPFSDNTHPRQSSNDKYYPAFDNDPDSLNVSTKSAILAASILGGVAMCVFLAILVVVMYRGRARRRKPFALQSDSSSSSTPPIYSSRISGGKGHYKTSGFWGTLKKRFDPYSLSPTPTVMT